MAHNNNDNIPYLVALRHSEETGAQPAGTTENPESRADSATAPRGKTGSTSSYLGREKRRSSRYKCEGGAEMQEEGSDVRTWATFTDISLHGCYVEAQATYPAGKILHMKLEAKGLRIETKGDVRVSYPYLGMGIAFVEMSEENKARLKQLLGVVSGTSSADATSVASPPQKAIEPVPSISNPSAAMQAVIQFFEGHPTLSRQDFLQLVHVSQSTAGTR